MHLINWLPRGAPAHTDSGKFEAALRIFIARIAQRASRNMNIVRDIVTNVINRAVAIQIHNAGGEAAECYAGAHAKPARRAFLEIPRETPDYLWEPMKSAQTDDIIRAVESNWENMTGVHGKRSDVVDVARNAEWFGSAFIWRPNEYYAASFKVGSVVELDPADPLFPQPHAGGIRDDPSRVRLGRIHAIFCMHPPNDGQPSDGFPAGVRAGAAAAAEAVPASGRGLGLKKIRRCVPKRMFVLVWPFARQCEDDHRFLGLRDMQFHAARLLQSLELPSGAAPDAQLQPPYKLFPLSSVLRGVRVSPLTWPVLKAQDFSKYGPTPDAARVAHRRKVAACLEGDILLFLPPVRHTFLPGAVGIPTIPDGVDEEPEEAEAPAPGPEA